MASFGFGVAEPLSTFSVPCRARGGHSRLIRSAYFGAARERISALEELMLSELESEGEERDAGWDTESLREEFGQPED